MAGAKSSSVAGVIITVTISIFPGGLTSFVCGMSPSVLDILS
jgi:hypothetical protein